MARYFILGLNFTIFVSVVILGAYLLGFRFAADTKEFLKQIVGFILIGLAFKIGHSVR